MLNVTTFLNEILPALCFSISNLYTASGLLPVGRPRTKGRVSVGPKALMRSVVCISALDFRSLKLTSYRQCTERYALLHLVHHL